MKVISGDKVAVLAFEHFGDLEIFMREIEQKRDAIVKNKEKFPLLFVAADETLSDEDLKTFIDDVAMSSQKTT